MTTAIKDAAVETQINGLLKALAELARVRTALGPDDDVAFEISLVMSVIPGVIRRLEGRMKSLAPERGIIAGDRAMVEVA